MSKLNKSDFDIEYIYFDVDNSKILPSLEALKAVYLKGLKTVYESSFCHPESGQVLHSMSSTIETEATLRLKLWRMQAIKSPQLSGLHQSTYC